MVFLPLAHAGKQKREQVGERHDESGRGRAGAAGRETLRVGRKGVTGGEGRVLTKRKVLTRVESTSGGREGAARVGEGERAPQVGRERSERERRESA